MVKTSKRVIITALVVSFLLFMFGVIYPGKNAYASEKPYDGNINKGEQVRGDYLGDKPLLTVNNKEVEVIRTGYEAQITIRVTLNGQPVSGQIVSLDGFGDIGSTDPNGNVTAAINPEYGNDIGIHVGYSYYYRGVLFAVDEDQGVVEVGIKDKQGTYIENLYLRVESPNMGRDIEGEGKFSRVLAREGQNELIVTHWADEFSGSYCVMKNIVVTPGVNINRVDITNADYIETDFSFKYANNPVGYGSVIIDRDFANGEHFNHHIGKTNNMGVKKVFISTGSYKVSIQGNDYQGNPLFLMKYGQSIASGISTYNFSWIQSETGKINLNIATSISTINVWDLVLDGTWVNFNRNNVRISSGRYRLNMIKIGDENMWYHYARPQGQEEYITVNSGAQLNLNYDLTPKPLVLTINDNPVNKPGDKIEFRVDAPTPSGYLLEHINNCDEMDVNIIMPDGRENHWRTGFGDGRVEIYEEDPTGVYTVNVKGNFERLYGDYSLTGSFRVERPVVTINSKEAEIVRVRESSNITIGVEFNGQPLSGQEIFLDGYGSVGFTDADGYLTATINPEWGQNIGIRVGQSYYRDKLFAVEDNQGVVEVRLKDPQGNDVENLSLRINGEFMENDTEGYGRSARILAGEGENDILIIHRGDGNVSSYFILKSINVMPGTSINLLQFTGNDYVESNFNFMYDSNPIKFNGVSLGIDSMNNRYFNVNIGNTNDLGSRKVFLPPGTYDISVNGKDYQGSSVFFTKNDQQIFNTTYDYNYQWYQAETGKLKLNITSNLPVIENRVLQLDGKRVEFRDSNELTVIAGSYRITLIKLRYNNGSDSLDCDYRKPNGEEEIITVDPGQMLDLNYDLTPEALSLQISNPIVRPGKSVYYKVSAPTPSGYYLNYMNMHDRMEVTVIKSNGERDYLGWQPFRDGRYFLDNNAQPGTYTINAKGNLDQLYGDYNLTDEFRIVNPEISINNEQYKILRVGETSNISVKVQAEGSPLANRRIFIGKYAEGTTDQNGVFSAEITPEYGENININVDGGFRFTGVLFAVNDNQGVVEVGLKDIQGNDVENFNLTSESQNIRNDTQAQGCTARFLTSKGQNDILVTRWGEGDEGSYFILKSISVAAGTDINEVVITSSDYINTNSNFKYDNDFIRDGAVFLGINSINNRYFNQDIGTTNDLGTRKIFLAPGTYRVGIMGKDNQGNSVYLTKNKQQIINSNAYSYLWNKSDTGKLNINISTPIQTINNRTLVLDGAWVNANQNQLTISNGTHRLDMIEISDNNMWYHYAKPKGLEEYITIQSGGQFNLNCDLAPMPLKLIIEGNTVNKPGDIIRYRIAAPTPSGYLLSGIKDHEEMGTNIIMPDGRDNRWRAGLKGAGWFVDDNEPTGVYTIDIRGNFERLYGDFEMTGTFRVAKPEVTINNKEVGIVKAGESSSITIGVEFNGQPLAEQKVSIDGYGEVGTTDAEGYATATINPQWGQNIGIRVGESYYQDKLFAVEDNQGVVEVRLEDPQGNDEENLYLRVQGERMGNDIRGQGISSRVLANEGQNDVLVTRWGQGNANSYFILKSINVEAGTTVNTVQISSSDYMETNLNFIYENNPIKYHVIYLGKNSVNDRFFNMDIGATDELGSRKVFLAPGTYEVSIMGKDDQGSSIFFTKNDQQIFNTIHDYSYQWNHAETGKLKLNITSNLPSLENRVLELDGKWVEFRDSNELTVSAGSYRINKINLSYNNGSEYLGCDYRKPDGEEETITIDPGQILDLNYDLTPETLSLQISNPIVRPGESVNYRVTAPTPSGYYLNYLDRHEGMEVTVIKPNGESNYLGWQFFGDGRYYLDNNAQPGTYTLIAKGNLDQLYGDYNLSAEFTVGNPEISINNEQYKILRVGETSNISVMVQVAGSPLANKNINIGKYASGITDENGMFTAVITPEYGEDINIHVDGGFRFSGVLFAVDENQSVVEVRAADIHGNTMNNFWSRVMGKYMNEYNGQMGDTVRVLAGEGENLLLLNSDMGYESYNIVKKINVDPNIEINRVFVNSDNTVEADLNLALKGTPIDNGEIILEKADASYFGNMHGYIGHTNSNGFKRVYITPGFYTVILDKTDGYSVLNGNNTLMYLVKDGVNINENNHYELNWGSSDVGNLKLNIKSPFGSMERKAIMLNDSLMLYAAGSNEMIISKGKYKVDRLRVEDDTLGEWIGYDYRKEMGKEDTIVIDSGKIFNYNIDLNIKNIDLKLDRDMVEKGNVLRFGVEALSNSGYILDWVDNHDRMNVRIKDPRGHEVNMYSYFRHEGYYVDYDAPSGKYVINADVNLGPVLGEYNFTEEFQVIGKYDLIVQNTWPVNNSKDVPVDTDIKINFNSIIQKGTNFDEIKLIQLSDAGNQAADAVLSIDNSTLVVKPVQSLKYNTTYEVVLPAASVKNDMGQSLLETCTIMFTTKAPYADRVVVTEPSAERLYVTDTLPGNNSTNAPIGQVITVTFNKKIKLAFNADMNNKVKASAISLTDGNGKKVPIEYSAAGSSLIIRPKYNLDFNTMYEVNIPVNALFDENKNRLDGNYAFTFFTEAMKAETPVSSPDEESTQITVSIVSVNDMNGTAAQGSKYELPRVAAANLSDGSVKDYEVTWNVSDVDTSKTGTYIFEGIIEGFEGKVKLTLKVVPAKPEKEVIK